MAPKIKTEHGEFELTPDRASMWAYIGRIAWEGIELEAQRLNHILVEIDEEEPIQFRIYQEHGEAYQQLVELLASGGYPLHVNLNRIPPDEVKAYFDTLDRIASASVPDELPEEWL